MIIYGRRIIMQAIAQFHKVTSAEYIKNFKDVDEAEIKSIYDNIKLPQRATTGSVGYDFYAPFSFELYPQESVIIPTGIRCEINHGWGLFLFPRSGLGSKFRCQIDNTVGVVDSDYYKSDNEGHIFAKITNDSKDGKVLNVEQGQAFMQGVFLPVGYALEDSVTTQRNGGFGSTDNR